MKSINKLLLSSLFLLGMAFSVDLLAWDANITITHLEQALQALKDNKLEVAETHMKIARQTVKEVIGGSIEAKVQNGSNLIMKARRQAQGGDLPMAAGTLREALGIFKAIHEESKSRRGGLD
jgi:hypothetical protein